jgi:hypothetical protein
LSPCRAAGVERTFSWLVRNRRLAKDFENLAETLATFVTLASIQLGPQAARQSVGRDDEGLQSMGQPSFADALPNGGSFAPITAIGLASIELVKSTRSGSSPISTARARDDPKGPLFRTVGRSTGKLTRTVLSQANAYAMIWGRAAAAGIETKPQLPSNRDHNLLKNGGALEKAAAMANHASTRTTQFCDRRAPMQGEPRMRSSGSPKSGSRTTATRLPMVPRYLLPA